MQQVIDKICSSDDVDFYHKILGESYTRYRIDRVAGIMMIWVRSGRYDFYIINRSNPGFQVIVDYWGDNMANIVVNGTTMQEILYEVHRYIHLREKLPEGFDIGYVSTCLSDVMAKFQQCL